MPRKKSQNKNSGYKDKLFRIDAELAADLESICSGVWSIMIQMRESCLKSIEQHNKKSSRRMRRTQSAWRKR